MAASPVVSKIAEAMAAKVHGDEHIDPVSLDGYNFNAIIQYIVNARREGTESLISLHYPASKAYDLAVRLERKLTQLDQDKIRRCEYDFESGILYLDIMPVRPLHYVVQEGVKVDLRGSLAALIPAIDDAKLRHRVSQVLEMGEVDIRRQGKIWKQGDISFCEPGSGRLSSVVGEISTSHVERKAIQYIDGTQGEIQAVFIVDMLYPTATKAKMSLFTADGTKGHWVQRSVIFYDDALEEQPIGQLGLYLSDFLGARGLPTAFCRPSAAELAAEISRVPQIIMSFDQLRAIFLYARDIHRKEDVPAPGRKAKKRAREEEEQVDGHLSTNREEAKRARQERYERRDKRQRLLEEQKNAEGHILELERRATKAEEEALKVKQESEQQVEQAKQQA
ncbi:hypothetical protein B0T25DRAFT_470020, partial [Lasiosphaeria hispida]